MSTAHEVVRDAALLHLLRPDGAGYEVAAATPFQSPGWWRAWIGEAARAEGAVPLLVEAQLPRGRGRVRVGLQLHDHGSVRVLRPLSWPWADYHEAAASAAAAASPADAARALAEALDHAQRTEHAQLDLPDVVDGGLLHRAAVALGARIRRSSPVVSIDLGDPARVRRIHDRGELARKRRRLAALGRVCVSHVRETAATTARLPAFVALHRAQWAGRPDAVAPFDGGAVDRTFAALAAQPDAGVVLSELRLDDAPLAMYFGFLHADRYWAYRTAFDNDHRRLSPGHLLVAAMISDFAAAGVTAFDLMRGDYRYKLELPGLLAANVHAERDCP